MDNRLLLLCTALLLFSVSSSAENKVFSTPPLMLANVYEGSVDLRNYWISEKLDGVRAYWDGHGLISRKGYRFSVPQWFTRGFPQVPLDGELWMGRGTYEHLSAAVRRVDPLGSEWRRIRFVAFDLPSSKTRYDERYKELAQLVEKIQSQYLYLIERFRIVNEPELMEKLDAVTKQGGEGLMLIRGSSLYLPGRSDSLLKLKRFQDGEAVVIRHYPGNGKYAGMLGSLLVETADGTQFRVGSGFSDDERLHPPPLGSIVTYKYYGTTMKGIPRFASFLRIRNEP